MFVLTPYKCLNDDEQSN